MSGNGNNGIVQICYVVRDLESACQKFSRQFGVGPFLLRAPLKCETHIYRGNPAPPIEMRPAFVQYGGLNVELVQLLSPDRSAFRDMFPKGGEGIHHTATFCDDYEKTRKHYVSEGCEIASEFSVAPVGKICFVDTRASLGHMIELYPESAAIRNIYARVRQLAAEWDGETLFVS